MSYLIENSMAAAIPLWIHKFRAKGGPTPEDFERIKPLSQMLAEKGDRLLYASEVPGETADLFNKVAEAVAVLSFLPGGITAFRSHWRGNPAPAAPTPEPTPKRKPKPARSPLPPEPENIVESKPASDFTADVNAAIKSEQQKDSSSG